MKLLAAQQIGGPESAGLEVVAKVEMLSFAGPVFDHGGIAVECFPVVMAAQVQCVAGIGHHAVRVAEAV